MERAAAKEKAEEPKSLSRKILSTVLGFLDQTWLQTLQYLVFLFAFQSLTATIRKSDEFYFDKHLTDTFINNPFDADHNRFNDVRRIADIWEWKKNVLIPGLFSNQGGEGESWPDGDGAFSTDGATPYSTYDIVEADNAASVTQGLVIKQARATPLETAGHCYANHSCYGSGEGADEFGNGGDRKPFGVGAMKDAFKWWDAADLGANTMGTSSASQLSYRTFSSGGFVSLYMPFFSETLLPNEAGTYDQVSDHRVHEATPTNGKTPTYYCARASFNGHHIEQRCNQNPNANDGVARALMTEMVDGMKKGHWIDHHTRLVSITMQMRNNNAGVRFVARYMFEITQMGAVLPSYDMETLIDDEENTNAQKLWMLIALILTIWFAVLEGVELLQTGPFAYFTNMWNVMDWTNFALFAICYLTLQRMIDLNVRDKLPMGHAENNCISKICTEFGYYDLWEVFDTGRTAKLFMSICVCIQLLKIIKFTNVIVPKMSLMTRVLTKASGDLIFFACIFGVSMFAFCMLFYLQLGSSVDNYYSQVYSMISLTRSLFGDFDIEEINENSKDYLNGSLFLVYLFVSVFILLALFLSILGEAQSAVRDDEIEARNDPSVEEPNEFGFLGDLKELSLMAVAWVLGKCGKGGGLADAELATPPESTIDSAKRERMLLVKSLKAFKPDFLTMIDSKLGAFEDKFNKKLRGIEAAIEDMEREQHRASGHRDASFKLKGNCADNTKSSGTGREKAALARSRTAGAAQAGSRGRSTGKKGAPSKSAPPSKHRSKRSVADATIAC